MKRFLVSSAGRRGRLVQLLQQTENNSKTNFVLATDASSFAAAGHIADAFEIVPRVDDPEFIPQTLKHAVKHSCGVVIPTIDPEIELFSKNRDVFESSNIDIWASSIETTRLGFDKYLFHEWLIKNDFPSIPTWNFEEFDQITPETKMVAKPRSGSSSIGVYVYESPNQLHRENLTSNYIFQKFIQGIEVTVDFAVSKTGEVLGIIPRRRLETRAGEVSKGVTIYDSKIERLVSNIATTLPGAYGILNIQLILDPITKSISVLELNPRFGGGYPLAHISGGNLIKAMNTNRPIKYGKDWTDGKVMLRYDSEVCFNDDSFKESPWQ